MTHKELVRLVTFATDLNKYVNENFADICDIDFLIKELKNKRAIISRRLNSNCDSIRALLSDTDFSDEITDAFKAELLKSVESALSYLNE